MHQANTIENCLSHSRQKKLWSFLISRSEDGSIGLRKWLLLSRICDTQGVLASTECIIWQMFETSKLLREYFWIVKGEFCTEVIGQVFDNEKRIFFFHREQEMLYGQALSVKEIKKYSLWNKIYRHGSNVHICAFNKLYISNFLCIWQ